MQIVKFPINNTRKLYALIFSAKRELVLLRAAHGADKSEPWGYFPTIPLPIAGESIPTQKDKFKHCARLGDYLLNTAIRPQIPALPLQLQYIKQSSHAVKSIIGGFHLDPAKPVRTTQSAQSAHQDKETHHENLRLLINLAPYPRKFLYARTNRHELEKIQDRETFLSGSYQILDDLLLSASIEKSSLLIPARKGNLLHGLLFWASLIPHRGSCEGKGHFLACYDCPLPYFPISLPWENPFLSTP